MPTLLYGFRLSHYTRLNFSDSGFSLALAQNQETI
jgi:hypothetical protein